MMTGGLTFAKFFFSAFDNLQTKKNLQTLKNEIEAMRKNLSGKTVLESVQKSYNVTRSF